MVADARFPLRGAPLNRTFRAVDPGSQVNPPRVDGAVLTKHLYLAASGAGTYTATALLPAGSFIHDIIVVAEELWNAATSAVLKVGDVADDDGFYTAVDLKATDLLAAESISLLAAGGQQGADVDDAAAPAAQIRRRYLAAARSIKAIAIQVGAGNQGKTHVLVNYSLASPVAAVKT